jgi:L-serine dehydratase
MKAAASFVADLAKAGKLGRVATVRAVLYGSLAWTGKGHGSDKAVMLGLAGLAPETIDPDLADRLVAELSATHRLLLGGEIPVVFDPAADIEFDRVSETPFHPNTLQLGALDAAGETLAIERWCSIGGGFVVREGETAAADEIAVPYPFRSAAELLAMANGAGLTIAGLVRANELALRGPDAVDMHLDRIIDTMMSCIDRGLGHDGTLPGGLEVKRRAKALYRSVTEAERRNVRSAHEVLDRVSTFAIAVNEENASGGRVVTAPTNGAAGVIPAVLRYFRDSCADASEQGMRDFLLTATAVGALCKMNASISGAEVGCQGEVGVACAMAAAGLAAGLGGSNEQIENAAEIGMEHHLGMTCDPIGGLVQIPCIERNAFGAVKAINAASLALHGDGSHRVSLDQVIATMRRTGADMHAKYKETSLGGLAVSFTEC